MSETRPKVSLIGKIFLVLFLFLLINSVSAVSKLVVLEKPHSSDSSEFILTTFIKIGKLNITVKENSIGSSTFILETIPNPPNVTFAPLFIVPSNHPLNSSEFRILTFYKENRLQISVKDHDINSTAFILETIPNPPNVTFAPLSLSVDQQSFNSSSFIIATFTPPTRLSTLFQKHSFNSSSFLTMIPIPEEVNITPLSTSLEFHSINSSSMTLTLKPLEETIADLIITEIESLPELPSDGDTVLLTATVKNNGTGSTINNFYVSFYLDENFIGSSNVDPLLPTETADITQGWTATPGNHTIRVIVDYTPIGGSFINESNEDNNERIASLPYIPESDLVVSNITWSPILPQNGEIVNITTTVKNIGLGNTLRDFSVFFYIDENYLNYSIISGLSVNESINITHSWNTTFGNHTIKVEADSLNQINESNEINNQIYRNITVIGNPDLIVSDITWSPPSPENGETVNFTATIENIGVDTTETFRVEFYVDGIFLGHQDVDGLFTYHSVNVSQTWIMTPGNHTITVEADSLNQIYESNEINNLRNETLLRIEYPDLTVTNLTFTPKSYNYKDTVYLTATIKNIGKGIGETFRVSVYINEETIGYQDVTGLGANESMNITSEWKATVCNALLTVKVDSLNSITESDETNNHLNITLAYIDCPDLSIEDISYLPENPNGNEPTIIKALVKNNNIADITETFLVSYYVNGDYFGYSTINGISKNEIVEVNTTWIAKVGEHNITAIVDWYENNASIYTNIISESNETNNKRTEIINVSPSLNILSLKKVSIQKICNFNSTELAYFTLRDEYNTLISADRVYAETLRPDYSIEIVNLTSIGEGQYKLAYENTNLIGEYNITIYAIKENYTNDSIQSNFTVEDLRPPIIEIISPKQGDTVQGNVTIQVKVYDLLSNVTSVWVGINSYEYMPCSLNQFLWECTWDSSPYSHGLHTVNAKAYDSKNNIGITSIVVDVFREFTDFSVTPSSHTIRLHPNESLTQTFIIENIGTIDIEEINISTTMEWTSINTTSIKTIAPGETTAFSLTTEIPDFPDLPSWCQSGCILNGYLTINANTLVKYLSITLDVILPDINFNVEPSTWDLGTIPPAYTEEKTFTIVNNWNSTLSISIVIPSESPLTIIKSPAQTLNPGEATNFSIEIRIPDNTPASSFTGSFVVLVNDTYLQNHKTVNIIGEVQIPLTSLPGYWNAGFMNPNSTLGKEFTIINTLADVENITLRVEGDLSSYISFDTYPALGNLAVGENTTFSTTLKIPTNASYGFYRGKIIVSTKKRGSITIPVIVDITNNTLGFITFKVIDNRTSEPIQDALVALTSEKGDYVSRTNSNGTAEFIVWSGKYNYETGADRYLSKSGNIEIQPGDPETTVALDPKPIISIDVLIRDENGNPLPIDEETDLPVVQAEQTYHFRMTIIVNTGEEIDEENIYVPPEFAPSKPTDYSITKEGDTYYVDWDFSPKKDFTWPVQDTFAVENEEGNYQYITDPTPGKIPLEIEGDIHFGGEKFMVKAIIRNLNDTTALPADAFEVKATLSKPPGISLVEGQDETIFLGNISISENKTASWIVKATEVGIHTICVNVTDLYERKWQGCAQVKAIEPPTVNIKYCIPPNLQEGVPFNLDAEITNPTELTAKDLSIIFTLFNENIKLAAGESPEKYLGDIKPNETKLVSWSVIPAVTGIVEEVILETFYEKGPVLSYEIGGVCGERPSNLSYLRLVPPIIYTTDNSGDYERVFTPNSDVNIVVVVKNPLNSPASGNMIVYIEDSETGEQVGDPLSDTTIYLEPNTYNTFKFKWNTKDYGKVIRSSFEFIGKRFNVVVKLNGTHTYGFYVDEYGVPKWLRDNVEFYPASRFEQAVLDARSKLDKKKYLKDQYEIITEEAKQNGFTSILFHTYYSYGYHESHQYSKINYWFPAGPNGDGHYSTPHYNFLELTNGNEEEARNLITNLVDIAHKNKLKVVAYIDPMAIYDPELDIQIIDFMEGFILYGYPIAQRHQNSTSPGWAAMDEDQNPRRVNFIESLAAYWAGLGIPDAQYISDANKFAYQMSPCGPGKSGLANDENAFSPEVVWLDFSDWSEDPSHHYHTVKQVNFLIRNYDFDGISTDDTGRLIMEFGPADYKDDTWTALMHPEKPTNSLYKSSKDTYCEGLRGTKNEDEFAMDAMANMINHMRDQIKYYGPDNYLISNDYFVPADVEWKSIIASEDVSASDQFNIMQPSFARWAYKTYYDGYKPLRNDLRRSLQTVPVVDIIEEIPIAGEPISYESMKYRPHLLRGVLLATSWANKVHSEVHNDELKKSDETEELLSHYVKMRMTINNTDLDIYKSEVGQDLLYHSNLKDPSGFQENDELQHVGDKPYTILYSLPSEYGEKARILHVINSRVITDISNNDNVPKDYSFKIKIPAGEEVSSVYLVSPDLFKNGSLKYPDNYIKNITAIPSLWYIQDSYFYLKVPEVITYEVAYISFSPANMTQTSAVTSTRTDNRGNMQSLAQALTEPIQQNQTVNQTIWITPSDESLRTTVIWNGSDLDIHLYSPSGKHIGFNYSTNITDLIENSTYSAEVTKELITIQNPEPGNWTLEIKAINVTGEEPYSLAIEMEGNYSPSITAEISPKTLTVNETASIPIEISNIGEASAYNVSVSFTSDRFNISENLRYGELMAGVGIDTEILAVPLDSGSGEIRMDIAYYDSEGNPCNLTKSETLQIRTNPRVSVFQTYSPGFRLNTKDTLNFTVLVVNVGSEIAYDINVTTDLGNITIESECNFTIDGLSLGESANFTFNATAPAGRWYTVVYAEYENSEGTGFLSGSNELEIEVEEATPYMDIDGDYIDEYANDTDNDTVYDTFIDPNNNSAVTYEGDLNSDNKPDFLVDTNNDTIAEIFYDPNSGFFTGTVKINETKLLLAVDRDITLDVYHDSVKNVMTRLRQYNSTSYYMDTDDDSIYDAIYDLLTGKTCSKGDLNCDDITNRTDYLMFEQIYETNCDNPKYNQFADFDNDCDIDFIDFVNFARRYEK